MTSQIAVTLRSPQTDKEWQDYFHFRWQYLRAPWQQPSGSEKDEYENEAWHVLACNKQDEIVAVGRLHAISKQTGQIRYMAVAESVRKQGIGRDILNWLEQHALEAGMTEIILHAREQAVGFYLHQGYEKIKASHTLFGEIKHMQMIKQLPVN